MHADLLPAVAVILTERVIFQAFLLTEKKMYVFLITARVTAHCEKIARQANDLARLRRAGPPTHLYVRAG